MADHDRLIAFLEAEATALRARIASLEAGDMTGTSPTGTATPGPDDLDLARAKAKLAEIESHLRDLEVERRGEDAAGAI